MNKFTHTVISFALLAGMAASAGADNLRDMQLRAAINDGRTAEAVSLIEQGADVNGRTSGGYTPLIIAAGLGNVEVIQLLLARGADPGLKDGMGLTALEVAKMNGHHGVVAMLEAAKNGTAAAAAAANNNATPAQPQTAAGQAKYDNAGGADSHGWPKLGGISVGQQVLYSGSAGKTWQPGTVRSIDPVYGYNLTEVSGSNDPYFVVLPQRQPFWTNWFVGDWKLSVPMTVGTTVEGNDVYTTVSGGMRLPPLRINADGTYSWRFQTGGGEQLLQGRWTPNPNGPGVVLQGGAHGEDWLVYNNTRTGSALGHTVILSTDKHTYIDGSRLK